MKIKRIKKKKHIIAPTMPMLTNEQAQAIFIKLFTEVKNTRKVRRATWNQ